jgi:hypothetical protein
MAYVKAAGKSKSLKTSKTLSGLQKQIAKYYALQEDEIQIFGSEVFNKKGVIKNVEVIKWGAVYHFKRINL